ncbi:MAG TPA: hypothetical protein VIF12_07875 [Micavibrio sp.]|jgi:hypothetical protein
MRKTAPIQDIMNQMASRMDLLLDHHDPLRAAYGAGADLDEIHLWIAADPLLADLHKRYLDLRANHALVLKRHGAKDPMTEIAADMADSAQCAADTRLIEVRQDAALCALVRSLKIKAHAARLHAQAKQSRHVRARINASHMASRAERARRDAGDSFWMLFVMLMLMRSMLETTRRRLSIAAIFQSATEDAVQGLRVRARGA